MKKKLHYFKLLLLLFGIFPSVHSQWQNGLWIEKQAYNWCFGRNTGREFSSGSPLQFSGVQVNGGLGSTTISDSNGQLLLYSGATGVGRNTAIWNKNHEIVINGEGLKADAGSMQFGVFVPKPNNPNIYYLFHVSQSGGFLYTEVDMTLDGGNGGVTENKNIMINDKAKIGKITAVHHANGKDIWVITHESGNDNFVAYLVTENSAVGEPVISATGTSFSEIIFSDPRAYTLGQLKASPDGKKLASTIFSGFSGGATYGVEILDFNNETGEISNPIFLDGFGNGGLGTEFSPNGRYVYGTEYLSIYNLDVKMIQFDLYAGDENAIKNSATIILSNFMGSGGGMQVGPDGKIYFTWATTASGNSNLYAINYPNNAGVACGASVIDDLVVQGVPPTFIQSYFESGILYEGDMCFGNEITFSTLRIPGITSIIWDFGDPDSGAANISTEPVHIFSNPGTYTVTASITSNGAVQTATTEIVIDGPMIGKLAEELLVKCADANGNAVFDLSQFNAAILDGQDTNLFSLVYFATEEDRLANIPIVDVVNFSTGGQTIYAVITELETGCDRALPIPFVVNPIPAIAAPEAMRQCGDFSGNADFNLNEQDAAILAGRNQNDFTIGYFTDPEGTNAINEPQNFTSSGQSIYVSLTDVATGCFTTTSFDLIINEAVQVPVSLRIESCPPFDLTTIAGSLEAGVDLRFYTTQEDAQAGVNAITDPQEYDVTANSVTVYIVAENAEGCVGLGELLLQTGGCIIPRGISPNGDGMNDTFDLSGFEVTHLGIFNRYGKEVYTQKNYTDQWRGQADNDNELPTGVYYYMIQLSTGETKTGWVYINRMN